MRDNRACRFRRGCPAELTLQCLECHSEARIRSREIWHLMASVTKRLDFRLLGYDLSIQGRCEDCVGTGAAQLSLQRVH